MQNPSITILIPAPTKADPTPGLKVLACHLSADPCLKAFRECTDLGVVVYICKGSLSKRKHNRPEPKPIPAPPPPPAPLHTVLHIPVTNDPKTKANSKVLATSPDFAACQKTFAACKTPGQLILLKAGSPHAQRTILPPEPKDKPKPKPKGDPSE